MVGVGPVAPAGVKTRMRLLPLSPMYTLPAPVHGHAPGSGQLGAGGWAVVAAESLAYHCPPRRDHPVRDFADAVVSGVGDIEMPAESTTTPVGIRNWALVAGPWSPLKPDVPLPATVVITPFDTCGIRLPNTVGDVEVAGRVHRRCLRDQPTQALVAGPMSPLKPVPPLPATVVITPPETLRTRAFEVSAR